MRCCLTLYELSITDRDTLANLRDTLGGPQTLQILMQPHKGKDGVWPGGCTAHAASKKTPEKTKHSCPQIIER